MSGQNIKRLAGVTAVPALILAVSLLLFSLYRTVRAQSACSLPTGFGSISQTMKPTSAATYKVWVRLWVPSGKTSSAKLSFNGLCADLKAPTAIASDAWVWVNQDKNNVVLQSALAANTDYVLTLAGQASGVRIDRTLLLSDSCTPTGTGSNCTTSDTSAPTINMTAPLNGQTVSGTISVTSSISNLSDVSKVELLVDGLSVATSTISPYSISWDSRTVVDGNHELKTRVTDPSNNTNLSPPVTVNVFNTPLPSGTVSRLPVDTYNDGGENVGFHDTTTANLGDGKCRNDAVDLKIGLDGDCIVGYFATGEWLKYDVSVAQAGTYTFEAYVAKGDDGIAKFHVEQGATNITGNVDVPGNGSWSDFITLEKTVTLAAGDSTLKLLNDLQFFDIAWIQFTGPGTVTLKQQTPPPPPPPTNVTSFISVDAYNSGGENVGYHDTTSNNQGDGKCRNDAVDLKVGTDGRCNVAWFTTGEWLKYDVSISAAGNYTFQLRASRGQAGNGKVRLEVDGTNVSGSVSIPATGSYDTFTTINVPISLPAGDHTLRLYNELQYFDVAWLQFIGPGTVELSQQTTAPPAVDTTAPSQPTSLSAPVVTQTSATLGWQPSIDSGAGVVGYGVYRNNILQEAVIGTAFSDTGLTPNTVYKYEVSALDGAGNESPRTPLDVTTKAVSTAPTGGGLSADLNGDGQFNSSDLSLFKKYYNEKSSKADFDTNGIIDVRDWAIFLNKWKEGV